MPVPKRKRSKTRRDKRFANKGLEETAITQCSQCKDPLLPHSACKSCGYYKGRKIFSTKNDRGLKRIEIKQAKEKNESSSQESAPVQPEQ